MFDPMVATSGQPGTKSDYAYRLLRHGILSGDYLPGAPLNQVSLAQEIGISTTPLREALRRLNAEGFVELQSHRDARVRPLSSKEASDIMEMRKALDPMAVELTAQRRTADDIRRILDAHDRMNAASADTAMIDMSAHREFHVIIYRACHNELLINTLDMLWDKAGRYRTLGLHTVTQNDEQVAEKKRRKAAEHEELVEAILRGDSTSAGAVMLRHVEHSLLVRAAYELSDKKEIPQSEEDAGPAVVL